MALKRNILANYVSQIYVTLIGIIALPFYIRYMGAEAYGLVGFYSMLQTWFHLLDLGLTPTMARETARFRGGAMDASYYRRFVRALEGVFLATAVAGGGAIFLAAGYIAQDWLTATQLSLTEVRTAVQIMSIIIAMRWMCGLYRGAITGSEQLVWLGGYNSLTATLRFIGVLPVLMFIGATPMIFFGYQLLVAGIELSYIMYYSYRLLPAIPRSKLGAWSWKPLKPMLNFSLTIAFTSSVWVLVTQADKLVLSKLLPLAEYGYFTLAVLVASGVIMIGGPISSALMPRMAKMVAEGDLKELIRVYRQGTQLAAVMASAASVTLVFNAETLLWAWTGDKPLSQQVGPILVLYAIGNGILAVSAFPYYLQYAKGDLRLQMVGSALYMVLLIPSIIWAASKYGGVGAGYVWVIINLFFFIAWLPFVHHKFAPGINVKWYFQDILIIYLGAIFVGYGLKSLLPVMDSRGGQIGLLIGFGFLLVMAGACASTMVWKKIISKFQ